MNCPICGKGVRCRRRQCKDDEVIKEIKEIKEIKRKRYYRIIALGVLLIAFWFFIFI